MKKQEYKYATLAMDETQEIVFATYVPKLEIDIDVAKELVSYRMEFSGQKPHYILIDFTNVRSVTKEARDYMNQANGGLKGLLGGAFLSNNVVATLFINLYLKVNQPVIPARFFTVRSEALNWLQKVRSENEHVSVL